MTPPAPGDGYGLASGEELEGGRVVTAAVGKSAQSLGREPDHAREVGNGRGRDPPRPHRHRDCVDQHRAKGELLGPVRFGTGGLRLELGEHGRYDGRPARPRFLILAHR